MGGNLFGIGFGELLFLAILALIVFGPQRIPEIARSVGNFLRQARQATSGLDQEVRQWMDGVGTPREWLEEGQEGRDSTPAAPTLLSSSADSPEYEDASTEELDQSPPSLPG